MSVSGSVLTLAGLGRRGERKEGDSYFERLAALAVEGVETLHRPMGRVQWAARDVIVALPWLQHRLLSHHTLAIDDIHPPARIGDPPVAADELDLAVRTVLDPDMVDPEPLAVLRARLFGKEI